MCLQVLGKHENVRWALFMFTYWRGDERRKCIELAGENRTPDDIIAYKIYNQWDTHGDDTLW